MERWTLVFQPLFLPPHRDPHCLADSSSEPCHSASLESQAYVHVQEERHPRKQESLESRIIFLQELFRLLSYKRCNPFVSDWKYIVKFFLQRYCYNSDIACSIPALSRASGICSRYFSKSCFAAASFFCSYLTNPRFLYIGANLVEST